jgi:glycine cleavage system H protein
MPTVRGCNLPDDLLYDVENHTWFTEVGDGTVRIGMTTIATAMAGQLVAFTPKKMLTNPGMANEDPYSAWMVQLQPDDWDSVKAGLTPGSDVAGPYEAKMDSDGFEGCG